MTTRTLPQRYYVQQTGSEYRVVDGDHGNRPVSSYTLDLTKAQAWRDSEQRTWERRALLASTNAPSRPLGTVPADPFAGIDESTEYDATRPAVS